jgi:hypothetical protein
MAQKITEEEAEARRVSILPAARWCFLNFGFAKTSLDDIAKRANITPVHRVPAMVLEPCRDMVGAPTAAEFYNVCERVSPEVTQHHRQVVLDAIATILKDSDAAAGRAGAEHRPQRVRGPGHAAHRRRQGRSLHPGIRRHQPAGTGALFTATLASTTGCAPM